MLLGGPALIPAFFTSDFSWIFFSSRHFDLLPYISSIVGTNVALQLTAGMNKPSTKVTGEVGSLLAIMCFQVTVGLKLLITMIARQVQDKAKKGFKIASTVLCVSAFKSFL